METRKSLTPWWTAAILGGLLLSLSGLAGCAKPSSTPAAQSSQSANTSQESSPTPQGAARAAMGIAQLMANDSGVRASAVTSVPCTAMYAHPAVAYEVVIASRGTTLPVFVQWQQGRWKNIDRQCGKCHRPGPLTWDDPHRDTSSSGVGYPY